MKSLPLRWSADRCGSNGGSNSVDNRVVVMVAACACMVRMGSCMVRVGSR